jgi:hypothetical protein
MRLQLRGTLDEFISSESAVDYEMSHDFAHG